MVTKIRGAMHVENRSGACFTLCAPMPGAVASNGATPLAWRSLNLAVLLAEPRATGRRAGVRIVAIP
jgi:hypothetical protein